MFLPPPLPPIAFPRTKERKRHAVHVSLCVNSEGETHSKQQHKIHLEDHKHIRPMPTSILERFNGVPKYNHHVFPAQPPATGATTNTTEVNLLGNIRHEQSGRSSSNSLLSLQSVLLIVMDDVDGPIIADQQPSHHHGSANTDKSSGTTAAGLSDDDTGFISKRNFFDNFQPFLIPKSDLSKRLQWLHVPSQNTLLLYFPDEIKDKTYDRYVLRFCISFAFKTSDRFIFLEGDVINQLLSPFIVAIESVAEELREVEMRYGYIAWALNEKRWRTGYHTKINAVPSSAAAVLGGGGGTAAAKPPTGTVGPTTKTSTPTSTATTALPPMSGGGGTISRGSGAPSTLIFGSTTPLGGGGGGTGMSHKIRDAAAVAKANAATEENGTPLRWTRLEALLMMIYRCLVDGGGGGGGMRAAMGGDFSQNMVVHPTANTLATNNTNTNTTTNVVTISQSHRFHIRPIPQHQGVSALSIRHIPFPIAVLRPEDVVDVVLADVYNAVDGVKSIRRVGRSLGLDLHTTLEAIEYLVFAKNVKVIVPIVPSACFVVTDAFNKTVLANPLHEARLGFVAYMYARQYADEVRGKVKREKEKEKERHHHRGGGGGGGHASSRDAVVGSSGGNGANRKGDQSQISKKSATKATTDATAGLISAPTAASVAPYPHVGFPLTTAAQTASSTTTKVPPATMTNRPAAASSSSPSTSPSLQPTLATPNPPLLPSSLSPRPLPLASAASSPPFPPLPTMRQTVSFQPLEEADAVTRAAALLRFVSLFQYRTVAHVQATLRSPLSSPFPHLYGRWCDAAVRVATEFALLNGWLEHVGWAEGEEDGGEERNKKSKSKSAKAWAEVAEEGSALWEDAEAKNTVENVGGVSGRGSFATGPTGRRGDGASAAVVAGGGEASYFSPHHQYNHNHPLTMYVPVYHEAYADHTLDASEFIYYNDAATITEDSSGMLYRDYYDDCQLFFSHAAVAQHQHHRQHSVGDASASATARASTFFVSNANVEGQSGGGGGGPVGVEEGGEGGGCSGDGVLPTAIMPPCRSTDAGLHEGPNPPPPSQSSKQQHAAASPQTPATANITQIDT